MAVSETVGFSAKLWARGFHLARWVVLGAALGLGATTASGCRTTNDDLERWTTTSQGPRKLVAVLVHDKYPIELRVEAGMALTRMKARGGRKVGLLGQDDQIGLLAALETMAPAEREKIVTRMVPKLEAGMKQPPVKSQGGQPMVDPSYEFKDAAFALLTHADGALIQNDETRRRLRVVLTDWCMTDFSNRMDESSQLFGVEQVLRELGAEGVARLPEQIQPNAKKIDRMSDLIAELGDAKAKLEASKRLSIVAQDISSDHWIKTKAPLVDAANKESRLKPNAEQFKAQLEAYQEEELLRVFASMKKIGGSTSVDFLLNFAKTDKNEKRRAAALAALEGNLDKNKEDQVKTVLDIASAPDTPDTVRDVALRRVGELPRKLVVEKLYTLFQNDNWKIRWVAAELVLKMSDTSHLSEFMGKIAPLKHMALTEPLRYGALIGLMKGNAKDAVKKYSARDNATPVRLTALGYYYDNGVKSEISVIEPFAEDRSKVPGCKEGVEDCEWKCAVGEGKAQEIKEVKTLGEFVSFCLKPAMDKRATPPKSDSKGK
jgi:hypothetical protein